MKNKGIFRLLTLLLAVVMCTTAFSMTAFASDGGEEYEENTFISDNELLGEETVDMGFAFPEGFQPFIENMDIDAIRDVLLSLLNGINKDTEKENVPSQSLTPDGNMTLIDDIGKPEDSGKQFITVQTKNGNVFYIIIDRDDEGEATVHFLNQVDEADLLALMKDGETETEPVKCICSDKCSIGAINTDCPVCLLKISECTGVKPEPVKPAAPTDPEPSDTDKDAKKGGNVGMIAFVLVILASGGGAAFYFLVIKKKGKSKKIPSTLDDFDLEDEEYLIEDENDADTEDNE